MSRPLLTTACLLALLAALPAPAVPQDAPASALAGAERDDGTLGLITAWRRDVRLLLSIPPEAVGRPVLWNVAVVGLPAGVVAKATRSAHVASASSGSAARSSCAT